MTVLDAVYSDMLETAYNSGLKVLSDEYCCELLAVCYFVAPEEMVFDPIVRSDLMYAQKRLNLIGGEKPNAELIPMLQKKIAELEKNNDVALSVFGREKDELPGWAIEIAKKINFKPWMMEV